MTEVINALREQAAEPEPQPQPGYASRYAPVAR
jgi:hypothetical protein